MPTYPQSTSTINAISYPAGPTPVGAALTASSSANTKGSYTQVASSSSFACNAVAVMVPNTQASAGRLFLFDIATGAAASEVVQLSNLTAEGTNTSTSISGIGLSEYPLKIAASTRIAARCQDSTGSGTMNVQVILIAAGDLAGATSLTTYGASTSTSGGTQIDPGATANTKGSYTQITSSSTAVAQWLQLLVTSGRSTYASIFWLVDVATGAASSEVVLIPDLFFTSTGSSATTPTLQPRAYSMLTYIASSTRIACRCSATANTATARLINVAILTAVAPTETGLRRESLDGL